MNSHYDQLPVGLIAQLIVESTALVLQILIELDLFSGFNLFANA